MAKHTPGPWHVGAMNDALFIITKRPPTSTGEDIAKVIRNDHEGQANAHLIAAAPDLLSALKQMVADFGDVEVSTESGRSCITDAIAAIAKAEGR